MSDEMNTATNGHEEPEPTQNKRALIAVTSFEGSVGRLSFTERYGNVVIEIDAKKLPGAGDVSGMSATLLAYGAMTALHGAYNNSDKPVETAQAMAARLMNGDWRPGTPRREAQPDELIQALSEHLKKEPEHVETVFLPRYAQKHNLTPGGARRALRQHSDVAPIIARIVAERARQAAQKAKGRKSEALTID